MPEGGIGASVKRKEDFRFLTGRGSYTDDEVRAGQLHAHMLRSPHGHAALGSVDVSKAESAPGVVLVLTGPDADADGLGGLPCGWGITSKDGSPMVEPKWPVIAQGKARYVGEIVAAVIAETADQAADAAELIEIDYRPLDAAAVTETAHLDGAAQIHEEAPNNLCFDWDFPGKEAADAVDAAFEAAAHTVRLDLVNQRIIPHSMEPRAAVAEYDKGDEKLTLYCTAQAAHAMRLLLGAFVLNQPEHKFRVVAPDVGGGFGSKVAPYAEYAIICWASRKLERPVRWLGQRAECFVTDAHGPRPCDRGRTGARRRRQVHRAQGQHDRQYGRLSVGLRATGPRPTSMRRCSPASTRSRRSPATSRRCSPTPRRSMRCAAPAGRRRPIWSSGRSTRRRG